MAKTGDLDDISWTQERIQTNAQMSGDSQERIDSQERFTSIERFAPQASQERFAPQASQEWFALKDELAPQESNATSQKFPEEVTNREGLEVQSSWGRGRRRNPVENLQRKKNEMTNLHVVFIFLMRFNTLNKYWLAFHDNLLFNIIIVIIIFILGYFI